MNGPVPIIAMTLTALASLRLMRRSRAVTGHLFSSASRRSNTSNMEDA